MKALNLMFLNVIKMFCLQILGTEYITCEESFEVMTMSVILSPITPLNRLVCIDPLNLSLIYFSKPATMISRFVEYSSPLISKILSWHA